VAAAHRTDGHDVRARPLDQSDEASILALRDAIKEDSGRLDILVNNAVAQLRYSLRIAKSGGLETTVLERIATAVRDVPAHILRPAEWAALERRTP